MLGDDAVALDSLATKIDGEADRLLESADSALAQGDDASANALRMKADDKTRQSITYREMADNARDASINLKAKSAGVANARVAKDVLERAREGFPVGDAGGGFDERFKDMFTSDEEKLDAFGAVAKRDFGLPTGGTKSVGTRTDEVLGRPEFEGTGRLPETLTPFRDRVDGDGTGRGDGDGESLTDAIVRRAGSDGTPVYELSLIHI